MPPCKGYFQIAQNQRQNQRQTINPLLKLKTVGIKSRSLHFRYSKKLQEYVKIISKKSVYLLCLKKWKERRCEQEVKKINRVQYYVYSNEGHKKRHGYYIIYFMAHFCFLSSFLNEST